MKRIIALILIFVMVLGMVGCGGSAKEPEPTATPEPTVTPEPTLSPTQVAFQKSKEAYDNINCAYSIVDELASDIYTAWLDAVHKSNEDTFSLKTIYNDSLYISYEELLRGFQYATHNNWTQLSEEEQKELVENAEKNFATRMYLTPEKAVTFCVFAVIYAYIDNGKTEVIQNYLDSAKQEMRSLSEQYSDYEHYPALKGYYTTTSAFFDYCQNITGSLVQAKDTMNDYRNEARNYYNDLAFIFDD